MKIKLIDESRYFSQYFPVFLYAILISGLVLRLWGIDFGLPYIYHTDEWFEIKRALKLGAGEFDFERVSKGGLFYLLFIEYTLYFLYLSATGAINGGFDFMVRIMDNPTDIWLMSRGTSALLGVVNIYLIYLVGKKLHSAYVGLFVAGWLAFNVIHVGSSHYATVDILLTTLISAVLLVLYEKRLTYFFINKFALLGILVAFTTATKIPGGVIFLVVVSHYYLNRPAEQRRYFIDINILIFFLTVIITYLIINPGIVFKITELVSYLFSFFYSQSNEASLHAPEFPQAIRNESLLAYYFSHLFQFRYLLTLPLFVIGIIIYNFKSPKKYLPLMIFILIYLFFLTSSKSEEHIYARYLLPLLPFIYLFASLGLYECLKVIKNHTGIKTSLFINVAILSLVFLPYLIDSINFDERLSREDTRTIAKQWVVENIQPGSKVAIEGTLSSSSPLTVPLRMEPDYYDERMQGSNGSGVGKKSVYYKALKAANKNHPSYKLIPIYNNNVLHNAINNELLDYVILRGKYLDTNRLLKNSTIFPLQHKLAKWVEGSDFSLIASFKATDKTIGPDLYIFKHSPKK